MSKIYGMAGLRIGWIACADKHIMHEIAESKHYLSICNSAPSEILSLMARRGKSRLLKRNLEIIDRNLTLLDAFMLRNEHMFSTTVGARWGWVRSFFGDVLAVAWVYAVFKTVIAARVLTLASAALCVGLLVELGQFLASTFQLHIPNRALRIVLGSTADWWDVLAYVMGFAAVLVVEAAFRGRRARPVL